MAFGTWSKGSLSSANANVKVMTVAGKKAPKPYTKEAKEAAFQKAVTALKAANVALASAKEADAASMTKARSAYEAVIDRCQDYYKLTQLPLGFERDAMEYVDKLKDGEKPSGPIQASYVK